jgi:hypothetical protein
MGTSSAWRFRWLSTNHLWIEDFPAQHYSIHPSINNSRDLNCRHKAKVKGLTCWVEAHHYFLSGWKFTQQAVNISYLFMISGIDWSFNCKLPAKNGDEHQQNGFKLPKSGDSWGTAEPPCKKNTRLTFAVLFVGVPELRFLFPYKHTKKHNVRPRPSYDYISLLFLYWLFTQR